MSDGFLSHFGKGALETIHFQRAAEYFCDLIEQSKMPMSLKETASANFIQRIEENMPLKLSPKDKLKNAAFFAKGEIARTAGVVAPEVRDAFEMAQKETLERFWPARETCPPI